jgi:uncharacterized protein (DUF2336 family)
MPVVSLIPELEEVVQNGPSARRAEMLRRITTLFIEGAELFNEDHVQLFDGVLARLIDEVDADACIHLAHRLAPIANAPKEVVRRLARYDQIAVAQPILAHSQRIEEQDLLDIAQTKGQVHLLALAGRKGIAMPLTDILARRGDQEVLRSLAENLDARISDAGFAALIEASTGDAVLAERIGLRPDIPQRLSRDLLLQSTQDIQQRLLSSAKPQARAEIERALADASARRAASAAEREHAPAACSVSELRRDGQLDEAAVMELARSGQYEQLIAALASLCEVPIEVVNRVMAGDRADPILILCKSAGWHWQTVKAILAAKPQGQTLSSLDLDAAFSNFERLSPTTAQRVMRFWQVQHWHHATD